MTSLYQSRKICAFQKALKTTMSIPLSLPPAKSKVFSRWKSHLATLLFEIEYAYPADGVTKRFVYSHLKRLFPTAQDQEDYFKSPEFLSNYHKSLNMYNWTKLHILVLSHCPFVISGVVALVPTSTSALITLISVCLAWSRCIRCAYWDHEEKKQKVRLWRILF